MLWADLGLCELKRGRRQPSVHASLLAVRWGDEKVRKNAYFNLHKAFALPAGKEVGAQPASSSEACGVLTPDPEFGPGKPIVLCSAYGDVGGTMHEEISLEYIFVIENDQPKYTNEGSFGAIDGWPLYDEMIGLVDRDIARDGSTPRSTSPLERYLVSESKFSWYHGVPCTWDMSSSEVVSKWITRCEKKTRGDTNGCQKKAEARVEKTQAEQGTWPELDQEIEQVQSDLCGGYSDRTDCSVVAMDPEHLRAGVVCMNGNDEKAPPEVHEVELQIYRKMSPPPDAGTP
jgi:hypothetical protein